MPKIDKFVQKIDSNGTVVDIPIDAASVMYVYEKDGNKVLVPLSDIIANYLEYAANSELVYAGPPLKGNPPGGRSRIWVKWPYADEPAVEEEVDTSLPGTGQPGQ